MVRLHVDNKGRAKYYGKKGFFFSETLTRTMYREAYVNRYDLCAPDPWEQDGAYSLHLTEKAARKAKVNRWWISWRDNPRRVFVSSKTLENISKNKQMLHVDSDY